MKEILYMLTGGVITFFVLLIIAYIALYKHVTNHDNNKSI
jgi:hypothetical protein